MLWREDNQDTIVALNPLTGVVNFFNPTLAMIFKLCDGKNTIDEIVKKMYSSFPAISKWLIRRDVRDALTQLLLGGYIECVARESRVDAISLLKKELYETTNK